MYDIKLGTGCRVRIKLAENGKVLSLLNAKSFILKLTTPKEITQEINGFYDEQKNAIKAKLTPEILNDLGVYSISATVNFCENKAETKTVKIIEVKADAEDNYDCLTIELLLEVKAKPCGCKSPMVGENGNWYEWDDEIGQFVDTGVKAKGDKGDVGAKGDKGDTGEQGIQGEQGLQGIQGAKGETGEKGEQGLQGEKGEQGLQGEKGEQGLQGEKGEQGLQGEKGEQGLQGEKGEQGLQGEKGEAGEKGDDGKSAYQSYVDTTTDEPPLTEEEWSAANDTTKFLNVKEPQKLNAEEKATAKNNLKILEPIPNAIVTIHKNSITVKPSFQPKNTKNLYLGLFRWKRSHSNIENREIYIGRKFCLLNDKNANYLTNEKFYPIEFENHIEIDIKNLMNRLFFYKNNKDFQTAHIVLKCSERSKSYDTYSDRDDMYFSSNGIGVRIFGKDENGKIIQTMSQRCALAFLYSPNNIFNNGDLQIGTFTTFNINSLGKIKFSDNRTIDRFGKYL